ncbi:6-phosphogluconate dehydrogenase [Giardia duodenalis]|uniref:6-phosphogluconate dehydrogenase n=1 Tax=Giardia intestinalis TaxID=5741 RepID=V6TK03_GIAIN|nr:6-phosphogluconate dehydrogenase [Giardia intestinalis]
MPAAFRRPGACTREGSLFITELCLTCIAVIGTLQSVIGIVAQSLPLVGVMDYSSPIGPWMILWMAVANALDAFSVLFELITVVFFRNRKSSPELIFISVVAVLKIGVDIFMTYSLRHVSAAVVYLSTAIILHVSVLWISVQSHLSHKLCNTQTAPSTTASLLSETPIESLTPSQSTRAEVACFDPSKVSDGGYNGAQCEDNNALLFDQPEVGDVLSTVEQPKASRLSNIPVTARLAIVAILLLLSLCIHIFLCSQTYLLVTSSSKFLTSRSVILYSYVDDEMQTGRYISSASLDIARSPQEDSGTYSCIIIMLHDQGQDSTTLLPLARNASALDPYGCLYVLVDRPGYGSSSVGKYPLELVTEAKMVNNIALLLAAELIFDLRERCQLPARYNPDSKQYELTDARHIEACFAKQNISTELISQRVRFTCVGHGSGTSVCLTWAKLAARALQTLVVPVDEVVGIDYFPQHLVLEALFGVNASAAILQNEEGKLEPVKSVIASFSLASYVYDTGRYAEIHDYVMHLSDMVPDVEISKVDQFRRRTSLCTFSEGYMASISQAAAHNSQAIKLDEFASNGLSLPNTTFSLLIISAYDCTRGPSTIECDLFGSDEERVEVLTRVAEALQVELSDTTTEVYHGAPCDLWSAPRTIAGWLVNASSQRTLIK